ncbi:MAG: FG-GAP repeat domain-containing protein [Gaiellaceae bacterium]
MRGLLVAVALISIPAASAALQDRTSVPLRPGGVLVADLDRDRDMDAAVIGRCRGKSTTCLSGVENERRKLGTVRTVELRGFPLTGSSVAQTAGGLVIAGNGTTGPDVIVLRSSGNGAYTLGQRFELAGGATDVATGDVNGDGRIDIVTAGPGGIGVLRGVAGGGFAEPVVTDVGARPLEVTVERLDRDAFGDIAYVAADRTLGILEGDHDLVFASPDVEALRAAPVDLDALRTGPDATPDIAVATTTGVQLFRTVSDPGGGVDPTASTFVAGTRPVGVVLADVTRDNLVDIVALNAGSGSVSTSVASRGGGYGTAIRSVPVGQGPVSLGLINFDNDGLPDVVVANAAAGGRGNVTVLHGNGKGGFTTGKPTATGPVPLEFTLSYNHPSPNRGFSWVCVDVTSASGALLTLTLTQPDGRTITGTLRLKKKTIATAHGTFSFRITSLGRYGVRVNARAGGKSTSKSKAITVADRPGSAACGS